ncbi:uncharacterized protein C8R40DRAFT_1166323 [Lentinula edodes]|uniref:uncharacterized protein n=1 Tax=Lentinula edodes TaxID=5353 RepID=UPI001E8EEFD3|nr:uncharacterized protein C8R40DRAFT_1166323 [Lentinula edodes]KAH7880128.1 hypothetical protein C8R40DRAFT_1166323 [Lentinula edodes]
MVNPYAVWNTARDNTTGPEGSSDPLPSIYGALPFSSPSDTSSFMTFTFIGFNPSIANCTILGPNNSPQFRVVTDSAMPGYTILKTMDGKNSALIEWREPVKVEVRGMVFKQRASEFLRISPNQRYRIMIIRSQEFMWIPNGGAVSVRKFSEVPTHRRALNVVFSQLYTTGSSDSEFLGRISRSVGAITLEMTQNAVRLGLLQACIITTVLLQSGENID